MNKAELGASLIDAINDKVTSVKFETVNKRVTLPDGSRDWALRIVWEATTGSRSVRSHWDGFEEATDAVQDFLKQTQNG